MQLKSYFAGTVESAICLARQEMGEDAMLVSSRKTAPEARHLGVYEVIFAAAQDPAREAAAAAQAAKAAAPAPPATQALAGEMAEMRRQLARMSSAVSRSAVRNGHRISTAAHPALDDMEQLLSVNEVDGDLACSVLRNLEALGPRTPPAEMRQGLREDLSKRFSVSADLSPWSFENASGAGGGPSRIVAALAGPPGAGKTAMLVKLAVKFGISARRSTHIVSYDGHRIASGEQLRAYAAILGVGFETLESVGALAQSLKENSHKELILIDTPGYSAKDFDLSWDLTQFLSTYPHVDLHLVLSCAVKPSDISRMVDRYSVFNPAKLLFTRLDETDSYGVILNESVRTGLPISFLGTGPSIPDDFVTATKDHVADLLMGGREGRAAATA
jgi:flagellar biosynthesis protein FlhF